VSLPTPIRPESVSGEPPEPTPLWLLRLLGALNLLLGTSACISGVLTLAERVHFRIAAFDAHPKLSGTLLTLIGLLLIGLGLRRLRQHPEQTGELM
jgi:hypothetical protein